MEQKQLFVATCWQRGAVEGVVTAHKLSALLQKTSDNPLEHDARCEIRCRDGFSLKITCSDEGFVSDEDTSVSAASVNDSSQEIRVECQTRKHAREEDTSSANSSCSDAEESLRTSGVTSKRYRIIKSSDVVFCHTDPAVPCCIVFVVRKWDDDNVTSTLEALVLKCCSEAIAKDIYSVYTEVTRRLKWERYSNTRRKGELTRNSSRGRSGLTSLRNKLPPGEDAFSLSPSKTLTNAMSPAPDHTASVQDFGPYSLPPPTRFRDDCASTISNDVLTTVSSSDVQEQTPRTDDVPVSSSTQVMLLDSQHTSRYNHSKGPAPKPSLRPHPANPTVLLVPTKNGLNPYRVITRADIPRPPAMLFRLEMPPGWPQMSQFDVNNNGRRKSHLIWVPVSDDRAAQVRPARARDKSPARSRGFELPGAISQAFRDFTGAVSSHLRKNSSDSAAHAHKNGLNPKSVMKKGAKSSATPETKRVTFSAYSTVQVLD